VDEEPSCVRYRRRRGVEASLWADGNYTGCAYGYGDLALFTGPRDCPVCNGSGFEGHIETTLPHSDFGDPECCGCLNGVIRGDQADIVCNECGTVLRTVPAANVRQTLTGWKSPSRLPAKCARIAGR
jgi:ribosomal protein S27E